MTSPIPRLPVRGRRAVRRWSLLLAVATLLLLVAGCSSGGDDSLADAEAGGSTAGDAAAPLAPEAVAEDGGTAARVTQASTTRVPVQSRAVISTGTVSLQADDLQDLRLQVQKVIDRYRGEVAEEQTDTDRDGDMVSARIVIRVPSADFTDVVDALEATSKYASVTTSSEDVTTQVIDVDARVRAQTASLERMEALLARARSLKDIVAIESQLTRRQADLDSLRAQQAWLADQTALSTVSVYLEQRDTDEPEKDADGFVAGLRRGWHGLVAATTGVTTVLGAALPFVVVLALLGIPGWLLGRRLVRLRTTRAVPLASGAGQGLAQTPGDGS